MAWPSDADRAAAKELATEMLVNGTGTWRDAAFFLRGELGCGLREAADIVANILRQNNLEVPEILNR